MAASFEWLHQHEQRLLQHPFLQVASSSREGLETALSHTASLPAPSTPASPRLPSPWYNPSARSEVLPYDGLAPLGGIHAANDGSARQDRQRAEEALRLWQRAEAAHVEALKEATRLRQRVVDLEAAKARAEQLATDEAERRKAAEVSARSRHKELADERWRADDAARTLRRVDLERLEEQKRASAREREIARLETLVAQNEKAVAELAAARARESSLAEQAKHQECRAEAAIQRVAQLSADIEQLKIEMKANLDAEHERGEKAKEAIKARAARDRERARQAEIAAAEKAQELLQLWQRFKLMQRDTDDITPHDDRYSQAASKLITNGEYDEDNSSIVTTLTQQDALRARIMEARRGLESSQRKLSERSSRRASKERSDDHDDAPHDDRDGYVTPPPID